MFQAQQRTPEKPHQCDQCPTAFTRNHDLKRHKRIHWAVKPYPCDGCDKAFSRKDALKVRSLSYSLLIPVLSSHLLPFGHVLFSHADQLVLEAQAGKVLRRKG
ncbi:hypothetical protein M406DRAFT_249929 [Cryphonectria parasitica EP155]|uniref:C2H2-type domain-containing protein n=1 Tax=Cryphonectria parasitica (strain ATCC 38755 / EP155) TaxID=660469 RepID=A0A9P5CSM2_CRYP1|nr:uncharacterized protein M406DRAFT_249929 [Cryphonectria parasitica EP155]KAF3768767.1 hypothetical protein M406DRAFT_249929 [Cryphonectria parasitica EP155]